MNTAIIVSKKDIAGMNIKGKLLELFSFKESEEKYDNNPIFQLDDPKINNAEVKLYTLNKDTVNAEDIDKEIGADIFIFATRHSAKVGVKTLCLHTPGNWGKAELGGKEKKLCNPLPSLLKEGLKILEGYNNDYEKTLEATHHGPYLEKPCMFIEIGSSEEEWRDENAAEIIAKTIIKLVKTKIKEYQVALGLGGTHYAANFNKVILRTDYSIGHICPKYNLENLDEDTLNEAMRKPKVEIVLLDWKGMGQNKDRIIKLLKKLDIKYERIKNLLNC